MLLEALNISLSSFSQKSVDMGPIFVKKSLKMGPILHKLWKKI